MFAMKILMCKPTFFAIEYEINPWMDINNKVDQPKALTQWENLYQTYLSLGVQVELIDQQPGLPDMVFTANAGTVVGDTFISGNFRFKERKGEEQHFQAWFQRNGYKVKQLTHFQGGEGDALFYQNVLYMGYGFRSDPQSHLEIKDFLNIETVSLHLIDPFYYDFDTAFCPVGKKGVLYYPEAFDTESQKKFQQIENAIPMTRTHAQHFIGNSVLVGDTLLVSYTDSDLKLKAETLGVQLKVLDMSEFKKAGGGIKCLTLYLDSEFPLTEPV